MLNIDMEPVKGILFIRLSGILDEKNLTKIESEVFSFLKSVGIRNIVFNISNLDYIDKFGKDAIVRYMKNNKEGFICVGNNKKILPFFDKLSERIIEDELTAVKIINC